MTHTLIETKTLDACIPICAPSPQHTHIFAGAYVQHNTQHTMSRVGRVGKRPTTSTTQRPPECRAMSPSPPFPCCGLGCEATLLVVLKVREGIHYLFAGVLLFLELVDSTIELRSAYTVTPRGRCVTTSLLSALCVCGVGLSSVQVPPSHHRSSLAPPPPQLGYALCCVGLWYTLSPLLPGYGPPPPACVHWYLACWLVGCWFSGCLVGCWVGWLVVGHMILAGWLVRWMVGWLRGWLVVG